ncbi:MAG: hypothetical protein ABWZ66_07055, partial [Pyrinomonadaceae bacterium]
RFTHDANLNTEELRESLRARGIDPDLALTTIKSRLAPLYKFKESPTFETKAIDEAAIVFSGIVATAEKLGFGIEQLEEMTGISRIFILKLDRRLISLEGRSKSIASLFADKLKSAIEIVEEYILGQSLYPAEGNFKAETVPEIPDKQNFDEAVDKDPIMSKETKALLLSLQDEK